MLQIVFGKTRETFSDKFSVKFLETVPEVSLYQLEIGELRLDLALYVDVVLESRKFGVILEQVVRSEKVSESHDCNFSLLPVLFLRFFEQNS